MVNQLSWNDRTYSEKADLVIDNLDLTEAQREEVLGVWGENVYQNTPEERLRALGDLQTIGANMLLSAEDYTDLLEQKQREQSENESLVQQMLNNMEID